MQIGGQVSAITQHCVPSLPTQGDNDDMTVYSRVFEFLRVRQTLIGLTNTPIRAWLDRLYTVS